VDHTSYGVRGGGPVKSVKSISCIIVFARWCMVGGAATTADCPTLGANCRALGVEGLADGGPLSLFDIFRGSSDPKHPMLVLPTTCYTDASPSATITRASFRNNNNGDQCRVATNELWTTADEMRKGCGRWKSLWTKWMKCGRFVDDG
jgi:hypothetical protein